MPTIWPMPEIQVSPGKEDLAQKAAEAVVGAILAKEDRAAPFSLALAGGNTPRELYLRLGAYPLKDAVPWERLELFLGDERAVPPNHSQSNFLMIQETLLNFVPLLPSHVHRPRGEATQAEAEATRYTAEIRKVLGQGQDQEAPRFDLILLGLGADGHTASLFPGSPALTFTDLVAAVPPPAPGGLARYTFTPRLLNAARAVFFLVAGPDKASAVRDVLEVPGDPADRPARLVAPADGTVRWFLDEAAAASLQQRPE